MESFESFCWRGGGRIFLLLTNDAWNHEKLRSNGFLQFEMIINVSVSSFRFTWKPMLSGYESTSITNILFFFHRAGIQNLQTADSDV